MKKSSKFFASLLIPMLIGASTVCTVTNTETADNGINASAAAVTEAELDKCVQQVAEKVNEERAKEGLAPLALDENLCQNASFRAKELTELFDHTRPDGTSCDTLMKEFGIQWRGSFGENISYNSGNLQNTAERAMNSWMTSTQGHREAILSSSYNYIGIGVYYENGLFYWVQTFAGNLIYDPSIATVKTYGDIDDSGTVDSDDASAVLAEYSAVSTGMRSTMTLRQRKCADVNVDGLADADDATAILTYYSYVSTGGTKEANDYFGIIIP